MDKKIYELCDKLSKQVDEYELVKKHIKKISVKVEKSKVSDFKESIETQYSIRVIKNHKIGFTYATNLNDIDDIINKVVSLSNYSDYDTFHKFYNNEFQDNIDLKLLSEEIENLTFEDMFEFAGFLEDFTYKKDKRIINVKDSNFFKGKVGVLYINSNKIEKSYESNYCGSSVIALAKDGDSSMMGYEFVSSKKFDFSSKNIAENAANKAIRMLNAQKGQSYLLPIIFENEIVADIFSIIIPSFYKENIVKNKSLFKNIEKHSVIASEKINLIDDATNINFIGAAQFDDEGTPTSKKELIKNGHLNEFLYNYYYARKDNVNFSGNCFFNSFKSVPMISHTNLILKPSDKDLNSFRKNLEKGIFITNLMGLHMADPISGDFSLGAEGLIIENGELTTPVKEMVINGNILDILKNTTEVFSDIKVSGSIVTPSILVEGLKISGN